MDSEFQKNGRTVTSSKGFAIEIKAVGGILYRDPRGQFEIDTEWLVKPPGIILYKGSLGNKGFEKMEQSQIDGIFFNAARAVEFFGYHSEIWSTPYGPDEK